MDSPTMAVALAPGESGLVTLDWWNGVRSTLMDFDLSGVVAGLTLSTRPEHLYRALLEATAYGVRRPCATVYRPVPAHAAVYEKLYGVYSRLYRQYGREDGLLKELKAIRLAAK